MGGTGSNSDNGGTSGASNFSLKDKVIAALLAVIFGGGSSVGILRWSPVSEDVVRPNKYTSLDAVEDRNLNREAREELRKEISKDCREWTTNKLAKHEDHLANASEGWKMIYEMREDIKVIKTLMNVHGLKPLRFDVGGVAK